MKTKVIILMMLLIVFFSAIAVYFILSFPEQKDAEPVKINSTACIELGCPEDTEFVGSINSNKYYKCECRYAKNILPENLICFKTEGEAIESGYQKIEC